MVELKRLKNMINDCIAVGEDSMKVRHSQDNELIMKGQLMAYNQVLGLINLLISEEKRKASFNVNKEMGLTENNE